MLQENKSKAVMKFELADTAFEQNSRQLCVNSKQVSAFK